jgi:hypothetical protein
MRGTVIGRSTVMGEARWREWEMGMELAREEKTNGERECLVS